MFGLGAVLCTVWCLAGSLAPNQSDLPVITVKTVSRPCQMSPRGNLPPAERPRSEDPKTWHTHTHRTGCHAHITEQANGLAGALRRIRVPTRKVFQPVLLLLGCNELFLWWNSILLLTGFLDYGRLEVTAAASESSFSCNQNTPWNTTT